LENDYLRRENKILRSKFGTRVPLTEADRRILVKYGLKIKARLAGVISIAKPETLLAWNRRQKHKKWTFEHQPPKAGSPRKSSQTEALIVRLAEENNSWGYKRISGEQKKLGHQACPSYVRRAPAPWPTIGSASQGLSWKQFLQAHLEVTWATDFFTEEVWTSGGLVTFHVLFFLRLGSRRVWIAGCTLQPHGAWMTQQARNFSMVVEDWVLPCRYLVHDRDSSFLALDGVLKSNDLRILKTPPHAPLCNSYAERHVREIRETLDNLILLGPHQGIGNVIPLDFDYPAEPALPAQVQCESALGGLFNHYSKQAA
jgi:putative transposase